MKISVTSQSFVRLTTRWLTHNYKPLKCKDKTAVTATIDFVKATIPHSCPLLPTLDVLDKVSLYIDKVSETTEIRGTQTV